MSKADELKAKNENLFQKNTVLLNENRLLGERCNQLLKDKGDLTDRCRQLETRCNELFLQTNEQVEQIKKMKSDVIECFGSEYNVLVAKLLNKWEIEK